MRGSAQGRAGATVWLVGMMGAGKSSVGRALAQKLGLPFVDLDAEIERSAGAPVAALFAREGEAGFRARERRAIAEVAGRPAVVALGGGAIAQPGAPAALAAAGIVVHLRARPETLLGRLGDAEERPLLAGLAPEARLSRLRELLAEREAAYATAGVVVDTDAAEVGEVAAALVERLGELEEVPVGSGRMERGETSAERVVHVSLGERSYPIHLGTGTLARAGEAIVRHTKATSAAVVTVPPVGRRYGPTLTRSLRAAGLRVHRFEVPDGDASKSLRQVTRLYEAFLDRKVDRSAVVVALGGGMVGDLAGFVAATYLRGVALVQIPTTILAMVDASIGGKVGVNLPRGKNLVGAFHQPRLVWIDTATLASLPRRDRAAGLAEVIKAGAIWDAALFARLEADLERVLELEPAVLLPVLERACAIKAEVVSRDERESDLRALLNFGHTLGHAIEALKRYRGILHGEAVAIGMVHAARRSEALGLAPAATATRIEALVGRIGLPTELPNFPRRAYLSALRVDKKRREEHIRFVGLRGIGRAETVPLTAAEILPPGVLPRRR